MNKIFEKLWNDYFYEECSKINTEEEKALIKKAAEMHETVNEFLTKEQSETMENYIDVLCEMQNSFVKSAFFKGCEFAMAFLFEIGKLGKVTPD